MCAGTTTRKEQINHRELFSATTDKNEKISEDCFSKGKFDKGRLLIFICKYEPNTPHYVQEPQLSQQEPWLT